MYLQITTICNPNKPTKVHIDIPKIKMFSPTLFLLGSLQNWEALKLGSK